MSYTFYTSVAIISNISSLELKGLVKHLEIKTKKMAKLEFLLCYFCCLFCNLVFVVIGFHVLFLRQDFHM